MSSTVDGLPIPTDAMRQADATILLKLAKAFAQQYPCGGTDTLPATAPPIPAVPTS